MRGNGVKMEVKRKWRKDEGVEEGLSAESDGENMKNRLKVKE